MVPPPRPGFEAEPARSDAQHRAYKKKVAQELADKVLAEKDPIRRDALEKELGLRGVTHYDIRAQPDWPLTDWPYKGPPLSKDFIPKSHYLAKMGTPPENWCYRESSFAHAKRLSMSENAGAHMKMNPRRRLLIFSVTFLPLIVSYYYASKLVDQSTKRAGRLRGQTGIFEFFCRERPPAHIPN